LLALRERVDVGALLLLKVLVPRLVPDAREVRLNLIRSVEKLIQEPETEPMLVIPEDDSLSLISGTGPCS
jgi:hypothetical protein